MTRGRPFQEEEALSSAGIQAPEKRPELLATQTLQHEGCRQGPPGALAGVRLCEAQAARGTAGGRRGLEREGLGPGVGQAEHGAGRPCLDRGGYLLRPSWRRELSPPTHCALATPPGPGEQVRLLGCYYPPTPTAGQQGASLQCTPYSIRCCPLSRPELQTPPCVRGP